jgi:hypothetical protein
MLPYLRRVVERKNPESSLAFFSSKLFKFSNFGFFVARHEQCQHATCKGIDIQREQHDAKQFDQSRLLS